MHVAIPFIDATTGVVSIYAAPAALCPRIEQTLACTLQAALPTRRLMWHTVEGCPGMLRTTVDWIGPVGSGQALAEALAEWPILSFDVTEDATESWNGQRFSHTPDLGLWHGETNASGDVVVSENRLRELMRSGDLEHGIELALGTAWDESLESLRQKHPASIDVTWLSAVG